MNDKDKYIKDLYSDLKYSIGKFDTQTLIISGGALGFSLTFIKEIVPFTEAKFLELLYVALACFIFSIGVGFFGHYLSITQISKQIALVAEEKYDEIKPDKSLPRLNLSVLISLILGIILLVSYCVINIENKKNQRKLLNNKHTIEILQKKYGSILEIKGELKNFSFIDSTITNSKIKIK